MDKLKLRFKVDKWKGNQSVFVRNRIREILNTNNIWLRYIKTKGNPADLPTRGVSYRDL